MTDKNEQIRLFAARLCDVMDRELGAMMLSKQDECGVLLAAAHGRARDAEMTPEKLVNLARFIWDMCEQGRKPVTRSVDFEVKDLPQKIFDAAGRK